MRDILKSLIFSIAFYIYTAFCCFVLVFAFALPRRPAYIAVLFYFRGIAWVERIFLGLDYRVTGRENLPEGGHYVIALKHYSAYETLKMPVIFGDIAIILKRELSWIPFWGWYTIKLGMIPVDRGGRNRAVNSLIEGAKRVNAQGRPILIFPQGTRVNIGDTTSDRPYKVGAAKISEALNIPIIPVALNSGVFWPKHKFVKRSGVVDFKIMPAIMPGANVSETLKKLEAVLEPESEKLVEYARTHADKPAMRWPRRLGILLTTLAALFIVWAGWWFASARLVEKALANIAAPDPMRAFTLTSPFKPQIDGFPGRLQVLWPDVQITNGTTVTDVKLIEAKIWPLPGTAAQLGAPLGIKIAGEQDGKKLNFEAENMKLQFRFPAIWLPRAQWVVGLEGFDATSGNSVLHARGNVRLPVEPAPVQGELQAAISGYRELIDKLVALDVLRDKDARTARSVFDTLAATQGGNGTVTVPLNIRDDVVYASFLKLFRLGYAPAE